jgi:hypothetical protein
MFEKLFEELLKSDTYKLALLISAIFLAAAIFRKFGNFIDLSASQRTACCFVALLFAGVPVFYKYQVLTKTELTSSSPTLTPSITPTASTTVSPSGGTKASVAPSSTPSSTPRLSPSTLPSPKPTVTATNLLVHVKDEFDENFAGVNVSVVLSSWKKAGKTNSNGFIKFNDCNYSRI